MKKYCLVLLFLFISIVSPSLIADPLLVVVLMIKDEAPVVRKTLQPFVDAGIQDFLIFDTGSTDDTIAIVEDLFHEHGVCNGLIKSEPFVDFSTSRNRALELAQEAFPQAIFMLMPDAEWYMHNVEGLLKFCADHQDDFGSNYLVRIFNEWQDFCVPRLIRCQSNVRFVGVVHEAPNQLAYGKLPEDVFFEWGATRYGIEKSRRRWLRDCELLLREYEKNPHELRTIFYLAQTYDCLGDLENARIWYERRAALHGNAEENFIVRYRLARVYEALDKWDSALHYYLAAYSMRPHRAEPLVQLAQHYLSTGEKDLCFLFARRAAELPYPHNDFLFIEKKMYDYTRYDLLGISAWYVSEYELGEKAVLKALQASPDLPHLHANLKWYLQVKEKVNC